MAKRKKKRATVDVYMLTITDMTNVGLAMGLAHSDLISSEPYATLEGAQAMALHHYLKTYDVAGTEYALTKGHPLPWKKNGANAWTTGDMRFVMYDIVKKRAK